MPIDLTLKQSGADAVINGHNAVNLSVNRPLDQLPLIETCLGVSPLAHIKQPSLPEQSIDKVQ